MLQGRITSIPDLNRNMHASLSSKLIVEIQAFVTDFYLTEWNDHHEHHSNQSQRRAVLRDPVPHLQRQTKGLGLVVEEMLQHDLVQGGVEVWGRVNDPVSFDQSCVCLISGM